MREQVRVVITAGPTHEPVDCVRFLGNRSSGRMGMALAHAAAEAGHQVTLLLGPVGHAASCDGVAVHRFRTCTDLGALLDVHAASADVLIMAAAVADYRPVPLAAISGGKFRRGESGARVLLELVPTEDLLAKVARGRRADQLLVGFALEPREEMIASAHAKLVRKGVDLVVANPLESMDAGAIEGVIVRPEGEVRPPEPLMTKEAFARWFMSFLADDIMRVCYQGGASASETGVRDCSFSSGGLNR
ncbi:MAG: phosphopantothenoylcysteine decarboxylase [Planctomycetota bacterium]|nr:phosphopantothenoylcysteine decarboxylase [Planctomycetota bacterium]